MDPVKIALLFLAVILIALIVIFIITKRRNKNKEEETFDNETLKRLVSSFGGKDNIIDIQNNSQRLSISVKNLEKVELNELNNLGAQGVFVSGNKIKMLVTKNIEPLLELFKEKNDD